MQQQQAPFAFKHQLDNELDSDRASTHDVRLPGQPRIRMVDKSVLESYLCTELLLKDLEDIAGHLWMMSKQDSTNISPLHRQRVKNREIVITEDPRLHLVWYHDRIFLKPLPKYLLSHQFWEVYLSSGIGVRKEQEDLRKAALGFLRTYYHLIQHESDFRIATSENLQLIPSNITYPQFCDFAMHLGSILDGEVSIRYSYGEIRLTRLNFYCKIFLGKFSFHRVHAQYSDYFATFYGPILFAFAALSVLLSALQLEIAIESMNTPEQRQHYSRICGWFSQMSLGLVLSLVIWLIGLLVYKFVREWVRAIKDRRRLKKATDKKAGQLPGGRQGT